MLGAGTDPQLTVIGSGTLIVGAAAGKTVMMREAVILPRPQLFALRTVQVSVIVPPHAPGCAVCTEFEVVPEIRQGAGKLFE